MRGGKGSGDGCWGVTITVIGSIFFFFLVGGETRERKVTSEFLWPPPWLL